MAEKNKNKKTSKLLFYFAIVLLIVSLAVFFVNIDKFFKITGKATGTINLTIQNLTEINFTISNINWGTGNINSGSVNATLDTSAGPNNVTNGNWTGNTKGLVIENIGNQNLTLDLNTAKDANDLLAGTGPVYQYNVTSNESTTSCLNSSGGTGSINISNFMNVNKTSPGNRICNRFPFDASYDTVRIDIKLVIPLDSKTGLIGDTLTATATAV